MDKNKDKITLGERFYNLTDFVYEIIKNSFWFWFFILRGLGVVSLLATFEALSVVSLDIYNKDRKQTYKNYKKNYKNNSKKMFLSLLLTFLFIYGVFFFSIPLENLNSNPAIILYFTNIGFQLSLILLLSTNKVFDSLLPDMRMNLPLQIFLLGKGIFWTFLYSLVLCLILYLSFYNLIFLLGLSPGLISYLGVVFTKKIVDRH